MANSVILLVPANLLLTSHWRQRCEILCRDGSWTYIFYNKQCCTLTIQNMANMRMMEFVSGNFNAFKVLLLVEIVNKNREY